MITGIVEAGKRVGRRLGFPTANIRPDRPGEALPANGVYVAALWLEGSDAAWACMLNQGSHPTVPGGKPTIEANLLDYSGDLYGRRVRVAYLHFLRPERRFEGLEALRAQLDRDRAAALSWLEAARTVPNPDAEQAAARAIVWEARRGGGGGAADG